MSMKIFISGKVSGQPREETLRNFERGKRLLMNNAYNFISPLDIVPEGTSDAEAMNICINALHKCDGILLLSDSKFSNGSHLEELYAQYCKKDIFYEDDLE
jgi:hypothetical protein